MYDMDRHRHLHRRPIIIMMGGARRGSSSIEARVEDYAGHGFLFGL
jgi:hypothetical protein